MSQNVTKMSKNVTLLESAGLQRIPAEQVGECKVLDISPGAFLLSGCTSFLFHFVVSVDG
jgi:hypothetical protein